MYRSIRILAGILLSVLGLFGSVYGIRVAKAQKLYYDATYGSMTNATASVFDEICNESFALYPHNYNLCIQAFRKQWNLIYSTNAVEKETALELVELWCERGLEKNQYHATLQNTKSELIQSPRDAAEYWENFVNLQFWNSRNLGLLVKYYALAGRLAEASEILILLKGHPEQKKAADDLRKAWATEMNFAE